MLIDLTCAFFVGLADEFMPLFVRRVINEAVPDQNYALMVRCAVTLLAIYLVKLLLNLWINYWGHITGVRIQADMRRELFDHLEKMPVSYFDSHKTGDIMSHLINDLQEISEMAHHGPENIFISAVMLIVSFIMLSRINMQLTLIVFACLPVALIFVLLIRKAQLSAFKEARKEIGGVNAEVENSIAGIRVSKAYNGTDTEMKKFDKSNTAYVKARSKAYKYLALFNSGMTFFTDIMYLVVIGFGGRFFYLSQINTGDFVAYLLYISMFLTPLKKLIDTYEQIADGMSGFARYQDIMAVPEEKDEPDAIEAGKLQGNIAFEHVTFHYDTKDQEQKQVISDLSFTIPAGHTVALVGPSGGGKSTICNLIPRFYEIDSGRITIDGMDITKMTRSSLRKNIGMVAQDVFLFNGSIRANIAYGCPNATDEEVIEAAKKADIYDAIMKMEDGFNTNAGERGMRLSGGQRQRISIARVFLRNPQILILDEATSALDNVTELQIQHSLTKLAEGRTVLIVAHRLSTIRSADEIIVLTEDGIQERGTSVALLAQKGIYYELYESQFEAARGRK